MKKLSKFSHWLLAGALTLGVTLVHAADTIKVGVLHFLSGTMAISETTLKNTVLMLIDEQNKKGGLLGKQLEAVIVDPASNWPLFAEKARELLQKDKVAAVFGCWTSVSRKSVLPVFEELNGILFYPVQYEGEESSKNVFYTDAAANQQAIPTVDYLMKDLKVKGWVLAGTDYQQQLAVGRALVLQPKMLILDELTESIQPNIVHEIGEVIRRLNQDQGMTVLLVEQKLGFARQVADRFCILDKGRTVAMGEMAQLNDELVRQYLTV